MTPTVRIPKTSLRATPNTWARIISGIDPRGVGGFCFLGKLVRPGAMVRTAELGVSDQQRAIVVIECAGPHGAPASKRDRHRETLYILWRCELAGGRWLDVARASDTGCAWTRVLRDIAAAELRRAMQEPEPDSADVVDSVRARLGEALDQELAGLRLADRERVINFLHDRLASRLVS